MKCVNLTIIFFSFHRKSFPSSSYSFKFIERKITKKKRNTLYKNQTYKSRLNSQQFTCAITPSGLSANRARSRVMQIKMEGKGQGCKGRSGREGRTNAMAHEGHHNAP